MCMHLLRKRDKVPVLLLSRRVNKLFQALGLRGYFKGSPYNGCMSRGYHAIQQS